MNWPEILGHIVLAAGCVWAGMMIERRRARRRYFSYHLFPWVESVDGADGPDGMIHSDRVLTARERDRLRRQWADRVGGLYRPRKQPRRSNRLD